MRAYRCFSVLLLVLTVGGSLSSFAETCPPVPSEPTTPWAIAFRDQYRERVSALSCHVSFQSNRRRNAIRSFKNEIFNKGKKRHGDEKAKLLDTQSKIKSVQQITQDLTDSVAPLIPEIMALMTSYIQEYQPSLRATRERISEIATRAAGTLALDSLVEHTFALNELHQQEVAASSRYILQSSRLLGLFLAAEDRYLLRLEPYRSFMTEHDLPVAHTARKSIPPLRQIIAYCEARSVGVTRQMSSLLLQIDERQSALISARSDSRVRSALAQAQSLEASARFMENLNRHLRSLWRPSEQDSRSGLPYLREDYVRKQAFLAFSDICDSEQGSPEPWMRTGCRIIQPEFKRVRIYIEQTLPRILREAVKRLRGEGSPDLGARIDLIEEAIAQGNLSLAVNEHDRLLRAWSD